MNTNQRLMITFPNLDVALGGARYVTYTDRFAWVTLPGREKPVRIARAKLPPDPGIWTAFALANAALGN